MPNKETAFMGPLLAGGVMVCTWDTPAFSPFSAGSKRGGVDEMSARDFG